MRKKEKHKEMNKNKLKGAKMKKRKETTKINEK